MSHVSSSSDKLDTSHQFHTNTENIRYHKMYRNTSIALFSSNVVFLLNMILSMEMTLVHHEEAFVTNIKIILEERLIGRTQNSLN